MASDQLQTGPDAKSKDYEHSSHFWNIVNDILDGVEAMRAASYGGNIGGPAVQLQNVPQQEFAQSRGIEIQSIYLPKFPQEPYHEYDRRRRNAFLTNIYSDISNNLSGKPFSKTCELAEDAGDDLKKLAENIDGLGNNMHVFAREFFKTALDKGIAWIMADFTKMPVGASLEVERLMKARPYWVQVPAEKLIAVYSKFLNGQEIIFHARIDETVTELEGYDEVTKTRIRQIDREPVVDDAGNITSFGPATWTLFEESEEEKSKPNGEKYIEITWDEIDSGEITIGIVPLVPLILGKRSGTSWIVQPPLRDLAYMQIKLFQMESNLDYTKELTAFPMLAGDGVNLTDEKGAKISVPVGPRAVLTAPMGGDGRHGQWHFIEPSGSSLTFLQADIDKHKTEMRDLGMQPLTTSNLTVITTANVSMKAHSLVQAWALGLKDCLEQAWKITIMWLKQTDEPTVNVHTDFGVDMQAGTELADIAKAQTDGVISKKTRFLELKRRGTLSDDVDYDEDQEQQAKEQSNDVLAPDVHIDPVTGMPIVVTPKPGKLNPPPKPPIPAGKRPAVN